MMPPTPIATSARMVSAVVDGPDVHPAAEAGGGLEKRRVHEAYLAVVERHVQDLEPRVLRGFGAGLDGQHQLGESVAGVERADLGGSLDEPFGQRVQLASEAHAAGSALGAKEACDPGLDSLEPPP